MNNEDKEMLEQPQPRLTRKERIILALIYLLAISFSIWMVDSLYKLTNWIMTLI